MRMNDLLYGKKVRLTALEEKDMETAVAWYSQTEFLRLFQSSPAYPQSIADLKATLEELRKKQNMFLFGIRPVQTDNLIGVLDLTDIEWNNGVAWLAIAIGDENNRGKGYGNEAIQLALGFAFCELNLRRVQLTVYAYNGRAIALYEKLGFKREGVYREYLHRDGQLYDMYLYGMLRREWVNDLRKS